MQMIESGNVAAAIGVKLSKAKVIAAYPITPQTPLTEKLSEFIESGEMEAEYVPVESEHSALAICIAATSAGARSFTATSANGLLYMHEQIQWAAGARLPLVMCVVNRGVGAPWTVWNDHQDSISQRDTGWIQIHANDHQQIIDTVIKSFALAEEMMIPVMVCYDGYLLSHTYMPFDVPESSLVDAFLPPFNPPYSLDPSRPANLNTVTLPDVRPDVRGDMALAYMEIRYLLHKDMLDAIPALSKIDERYQSVFGRGGNPLIEPYLCEDADYIAVSLGSLSYHLRDVVDDLRNEGIKAGVLSVHLYRPFPAQAVAEALCGCKGVVVFEKALSYGYQGTLSSDIKSALYNSTRDRRERPFVLNYILGLGGREIATRDLYDALRFSCTADDPCNEETRWIGLKL
ncbi:MAG TPA: pyruvate ferredoxin oxidoreductase [Deltaproteobacteria bacterium]|nr:pyruvate ferredoxin oxidoreductase [Deltaproteobacteria bacterium]